MTNLNFQHVIVKNSGQMLNIASVEEASAFLAEGWPSQDGPRFRAASTACLGGLGGSVSINDVRNAFIDAAKEAGIYVSEKTGSNR
jgi:hypothetical protein